MTIDEILSVTLVMDLLALTLAARAFYLIRGSDRAEDRQTRHSRDV